MWRINQLPVTQSECLRYSIATDGGASLSFLTVLSELSESQSFREFWIAALRDVPFETFRWETPPITTAFAQQSFECVVIRSPELLTRPDSTAFADYFRSARDGVKTFSNLGGDAVLVVPCPDEPDADCSHLAAFMRTATDAFVDRFWQRVAETMLSRLSSIPIWLNTAGAGVAWLHVRLDSRPKYYRFSPYRIASAPASCK